MRASSLSDCPSLAGSAVLRLCRRRHSGRPLIWKVVSRSASRLPLFDLCYRSRMAVFCIAALTYASVGPATGFNGFDFAAIVLTAELLLLE
jgi:hypothetical protein